MDAVTRFARVDKKRRAAGAGKRRGNFAADMPGLPHSGDDNSSRTTQHVVTRSGEIVVYAFGQRHYCSGFGLDDRQPKRSQLVIFSVLVIVHAFPGAAAAIDDNPAVLRE